MSDEYTANEMYISDEQASCLQCLYCCTVPNDMNQCRRYAPRGPIEINENDKDWPYVADDDWCGEFKLDPSIGKK